MAEYRNDHDRTGQGAKVVLTDHPWIDVDLEQDIFNAAGFELVAGPQTAPSAAEVEKLVREADPVAILTCWAEVNAQTIAAPTELAIVARVGVGLDNIDVSAATERGAFVSNVPDYCVAEVSDHAIALLLAHYRGIVRLDALSKETGWQTSDDGLERISDLTVGIIGYGRIGRETARKLKVFGCRVLAQSRTFTQDDQWAEASSIAAIQSEADAIVIHAPLTAETTGMIDAAFLSACLKQPLLINVSRGGLVQNTALIDALDAGKIRGAALDVIEGEPSPSSALFRRRDIIVTPHVAFASTASLLELRRRACEEVVRALRGEALHHPCNEPEGGQPLEGGVASDIRLVETPDGPLVVKRALAKLRVAADWFSDPARSATEVAAIDTFAEILGPGSVPEIVWTKPEQNTFAMRYIDPRFTNWKQDLLADKLNPATAYRAGELLGRVHRGSADDPAIRHKFEDTSFFEELRIEPFFLRVADSVPECRDDILAVVDALRNNRTALVHGDYSPKNILADGGEIVILDFEVAHWGDPMFDVGFCVSHLILKALRRHADPAGFHRLITRFLDGYDSADSIANDVHLTRVAGSLMLARLKGASPVDYLKDIDKDEAERIAVAMIRARHGSLQEFLSSVLEHS